MGISPDTAKTLKYTGELVIKVDQQNKKCVAAFKATKGDLEKAIANLTIPMLNLLAPKLDKVVDEMDDCMSKIEEAKTQIGFLQQDQPYADSHFAVIKKLLEKVTDIQTELTEELKQARDLNTRAAKAWDDAQGSQAKAEQELAVLKDTVGDIKKAVDKNDLEVPKLAEAARKAFDARNQKVLTDARLKLIEFGKAGTTATLARDKVNKFMKKFQYKALTAEAQYLLDELQRIDDSMKQLDKVVNELVGLGQVAQIDIPKACKVLSIDLKDQSKLAKVLNGPANAYQKGLDTLAKDLKLDTTGKEMQTKLEKAQVI